MELRQDLNPRLMTHAERIAAYGVPAAVDTTRRILVPDVKWRRENIVVLHVPWPVADARFGLVRPIWIHKKTVDQFRDLFSEWQKLGLLSQLKSLGGAWNVRMKRGKELSLNVADMSTHCFGAAIDLNVAWNQFGKPPAPAGAEGSMVALIPAAISCGFVWGGTWTKPDGMHLEVGTH